MYGVLRVARGGLLRSERATYRSHNCALCMGLRDSLGTRGVLVHGHDLGFLALLHPEVLPPVRKRPCPLLPLLQVAVVDPRHPFLERIRALGVAMALLKDADDALDGDEARGLLARMRAFFTRRSLRGRRSLDALASIGIEPTDLERHARTIKRREQEPTPDVDHVLAPVLDLATELFCRTFRGVQSPAAAARLGRGYVTLLSFLDAFEDRDEDARMGRFNLCTDACYAEGDAPHRRLKDATESFAREALCMAAPANRSLVRASLDVSIGPRVARILGESERTP